MLIILIALTFPASTFPYSVPWLGGNFSSRDVMHVVETNSRRRYLQIAFSFQLLNISLYVFQ
jgi:hypothetical protein